MFTDRYVCEIVGIEIALLLTVTVFLWARGWQTKDFPIGITPRRTAESMGLYLATGAACGVASMALAVISTRLSWADVLFTSSPISYEGSILVLLLFSIVNPIFEELIVVGYVVTLLEQKRGLAVAVIASTMIRLSYHTYQGTVGLVYIGLMGLIFAVYYCKRRGLWPLFLAHGLMDFVGLYFRW